MRLGNKDVEIFKPHQYEVEKIEPSLLGLKEKWATGSLSRVKASAGEFFEFHLSSRKPLDGLGCLYKVPNIGEDGLGFRYISGPKKESANKGKFYSGIPLKRLKELNHGKSVKYLPVSNFCDFSGAFGNCRLEGNVGFKGGKKPEVLLELLLQYYSNPGDLVLDSFLGSGTTAAVAHKMGRKWIGIELGEHAYTHCVPRLKAVIDGEQGGISKSVNWQGGGGFKFLELAPSLLNLDDAGQLVISETYNDQALAAAMALHKGFTYAPNPNCYWKQGKQGEHNFIFTTTNYIYGEYLDKLNMEMGADETLIVCCKAYAKECNRRYKRIRVQKIPNILFGRCEFGRENYDLNLILQDVSEDDVEDYEGEDIK